MKRRNSTFDITMALMMLWVIWGHLGLYNVVSPETSIYMLNAKIGVNMPVFFVIVGLFAASTFVTADWSKLLAVFVQGGSNVNGMNFWKVDAHWRIVLFSWYEGVTFFARTIVGICGTVFLLFIVNLLIKIVPLIKIISPFGMTSLGVYVLHEYPLFLLGRHMTILPLPSWSRWFVALVVFLLCHFIVVGLKRFSITRFVFLGDEKYYLYGCGA